MSGVCVRVPLCELLYQVFDMKALMVIRLLVSPVITGDIIASHNVNSCNVAHKVLNSSMPEIRSFQSISHTLLAIIVYCCSSLTDLEDENLSFGCMYHELNLGPPAWSCTKSSTYEHACSEIWLVNQLSQPEVE